MRVNRFYFIITLALVAGLGYLTYQIIRPFLAPIVWGIVLSIVFYPVYDYLLRYIKWKSLASLIVLLIIFIIILGPFSYFSYLLIGEIDDILNHIDKGTLESLQHITQYPAAHYILDRISTAFHISITEAEIQKSLADASSRLGKEVLSWIPGGLGSAVGIVIDFVFMAFALFFMLRDGASFLHKSRNYMPFSEKQKERLVSEVRDIVISTIYGGVVVAILQGITGGIAYAVLGIRSPVLWGLTTAIASFVPMLGTFTVWGVIAAYLLLQGAVVKGIALALIGVFGISIMDNALRPMLIGNRMSMPVVIIFFSVLGGIEFFGLIGLIMGPLVVALFLSIMDIFRNVEGGSDA